MFNILAAFKAFWSLIPVILLAAAAGFVGGGWVQGQHLTTKHGLAIERLRNKQLNHDIQLRDVRDEERDRYNAALKLQRSESDARQAKNRDLLGSLQRTLGGMRDNQASRENYLRATAESAAARAATAEKLFGDCRTEYLRVAAAAGLHALDLQDHRVN